MSALYQPSATLLCSYWHCQPHIDWTLSNRLLAWFSCCTEIKLAHTHLGLGYMAWPASSSWLAFHLYKTKIKKETIKRWLGNMGFAKTVFTLSEKQNSTNLFTGMTKFNSTFEVPRAGRQVLKHLEGEAESLRTVLNVARLLFERHFPHHWHGANPTAADLNA